MGRTEARTGHYGGYRSMAGGRLEILKSMVEQNPRDSFVRYGLAMEYKNAGDLESAVREFQTLLAADPNYAAAYFHAAFC